MHSEASWLPALRGTIADAPPHFIEAHHPRRSKNSITRTRRERLSLEAWMSSCTGEALRRRTDFLRRKSCWIAKLNHARMASLADVCRQNLRLEKSSIICSRFQRSCVVFGGWDGAPCHYEAGSRDMAPAFKGTAPIPPPGRLRANILTSHKAWIALSVLRESSNKGAGRSTNCEPSRTRRSDLENWYRKAHSRTVFLEQLPGKEVRWIKGTRLKRIQATTFLSAFISIVEHCQLAHFFHESDPYPEACRATLMSAFKNTTGSHDYCAHACEYLGRRASQAKDQLCSMRVLGF